LLKESSRSQCEIPIPKFKFSNLLGTNSHCKIYIGGCVHGDGWWLAKIWPSKSHIKKRI
jgi:hypothetical protein